MKYILLLRVIIAPSHYQTECHSLHRRLDTGINHYWFLGWVVSERRKYIGGLLLQVQYCTGGGQYSIVLGGWVQHCTGGLSTVLYWGGEYSILLGGEYSIVLGRWVQYCTGGWVQYCTDGVSTVLYWGAEYSIVLRGWIFRRFIAKVSVSWAHHYYYIINYGHHHQDFAFPTGNHPMGRS